MGDFKNYPISGLKQTIELYTNKMIELELADDPDQEKIETIATKLDALNLTLKEKEAELASPENKAESGKSSAVPGRLFKAIWKVLQ